MSAQTTEDLTAAIELIVEQDPNGQVAANVPVRWKISEEVINQLAEQGAKDPYMLLVVEQRESELDRIMVPLKAGMTYLQMRRPGTIAIHATIVWESEGGSAKSVVMKKDDFGSYTMRLLGSFVPGQAAIRMQIENIKDEIDFNWSSYDQAQIKSMERQVKRLKQELRQMGEHDTVFGLHDGFTHIARTPEGDRINIEVPQEMFAAEPPRWMSWLGNLYGKFWPRRAVDQCDLRRRALFTLFTLPFWGLFWLGVGIVCAAVWLLFKSAALVCIGALLLIGKRNLDYSVFWGSGMPPLRDIWYRAKPTIWLYKMVEVEKQYPGGGGTYRETKYQSRNPLFLAVNPPVILAMFTVFLVLGGKSPFMALVTTMVLIGLFGGTLALLAFTLKRKVGQEKVVTEEEKDKVRRDLMLLTSGGSASLADLPSGQRTVRLRYLHLKATVCKPFAR